MTEASQRRWVLAELLIVALAIFSIGVTWGLPSRRVDPFLFGSHPVWTGQQIGALAGIAQGGQWDDPNRGADVVINPLADSSSVTILNPTDARRAQIVLRYRLYSYQPDEMITLMSLARMHPGQLDLDPRLYQYGGLWIYPVGALLKAASLLKLIDLKSGPEGLTWYLDHPEAFGRFYIVARCYVIAWGLVGVWAVFRIVMAIQSRLLPAAIAALCFIAMPVVVNMAHEAKPHLPGAVLVMLAGLAGAKFVASGERRFALLAGALCGAALGMVLSMLMGFAIVPLMVLLRPMAWRKRLEILMSAAMAGLLIYAMSNPYVIIHQFAGKEVFRSNMNNSTAMYHIGRPLEGAANELLLIGEGMSWPLAMTGFVGIALLAARAVRKRHDTSDQEVSRRAAALLLAAPAVLIAAQSALVGAGKPGEFGRFLLLPDVLLAIEAIVAITTFFPRAAQTPTMVGILLTTCVFGGVYLAGFMIDSRHPTSRLIAARKLQSLRDVHGLHRLAVIAEPAPYCLPPVNLFEWQIDKLPRGRASLDADPTAGLLVRPVDVMPGEPLRQRLFRTRISWANKPFEFWVRAID